MAVDPYWASTKWEYDANGDPSYMGKHKTVNAPDGDTGWYIWRYAVDAAGSVSIMGPKIGSWTSRTGLL